MVGTTGDVDAQPHFAHGVVLSLEVISRLFVVDCCTLRRGVTIQTFRSRGPTPMIGRRVPEKGCTCVGRLVWSTITVMESSCRSLRPP